ncbi:polysaccharide lyase beta-sandwich domain-containing protein [Streptomyces sp. NPDC007883]|uniref:polysaccharide lyase beta-sandwich domain-containing protein n=1 Tax=Streptomyces sp. NPDC007883 TaxID=3155116 RepID=UPI0033D8DF09
MLANDSAGQAVRVPSRGFTGVTFWTAGTVGPVTPSGPVRVRIRGTPRRNGRRPRGRPHPHGAGPHPHLGAGSPPCSPRHRR